MPTASAILKIAHLRDQMPERRGSETASLIGQGVVGRRGQSIDRRICASETSDGTTGSRLKWVTDPLSGDLKLIIE